MRIPSFVAIFSLFLGLSKESLNVDFNLLNFSIYIRMITGSPCLKGVSGTQAYPIVDLFQKAIDSEIIYENANDKHMAIHIAGTSV